MGQGRKLFTLLALNDSGEEPCVNRTRFAETPVLLRQVDMAIALGSDGVLLFAQNASDDDALAAQHLAENNGLTFRLLTRPSQLMAAVPCEADLVVVTPGALVRDLETLQGLAGEQSIAMLPADHEQASGLERLDLHHAWGGIMRIPGRLISQLEILGEDCEPFSALPRLARSSGIAERPVPVGKLEDGSWRISPRGEVRNSGLGRASAERMPLLDKAAHGFASRNLPWHLPFGVMAVSILLAIAALAMERPAVAILLAAAAMLAAAFGRKIRDLAEPLQLSALKRKDWRDLASPLPEMLAAFSLAIGLAASESVLAAGFAAVVTLMLTWIGREFASRRVLPLLQAPVIWALAGICGVLDAWWGGAILPSALSFMVIMLYLRGSRRITGF